MMEDGIFIISKERVKPEYDPSDAIYLQMILTRMANKNQLRIQCNSRTEQITEKIINTITKSTGWFKHQKTELNNGTCKITEYTIRRPPAIELPIKKEVEI